MKQVVAFAAAVVLLPAVIRAADPAVRAVTLEECLQLALQKNLDIRISRFAPELTQLSLEGAYGAYDPSFTFGADRDITKSPSRFIEAGLTADAVNQEVNTFNTGLNGLLPTGTRYNLTGRLTRTDSDKDLYLQQTNFAGTFLNTGFSGGASASLTQPLLKNFWIDGPRLTIQLSQKTLKQDELTVRAQIIATVTDVQLAYYNLFEAREAVRVQEKALELSERSLSESKKKVEVGMLAPLDEKKAEAQVAAVRVDLISARQNLQSASNNLKQLITDDYAGIGESLDATGQIAPTPYPFSRQESWQKALTQRPDLLRKQIDLEKQAITLRYRKNQLFPQLDLSASYGVSGSATAFAGTLDNVPDQHVGDFFGQLRDRDYASHGFGVSLTVPLSNRAERRNFKAAKVTKESLLLDLKRTEQQIMVLVDNAILIAQTAFERIEATRQAKLFAEQALDAEQKKLENGKSTYFEVLDAQNKLTTASFDALHSVAEYYRAVAQLHEAEGSTLEKIGAKLEFR